MAEEKEQNRGFFRRYWWLVLGLLPFLAAAYFYYLFPGRGVGAKQPIFFSHRVHAGVKQINCRFCHPYPARSRVPGIPEVQKCFFCHKYIIPKHPQLVKELEHFNTKTPVPWVRIYYLPDYVKFNHVPHIKWGKLDCSVCHGDVKSMDRLVPIDFKMQFCITCHQERKAQLDCWLGCHH
jgi:hypothetical protein